MMQEKLSESEADFREALEIARELFGDEHPVVPILYNNLGLCLSRQDRDREAAEIYRVGLGLARRIHPDDHPGRISLTIQLAETLKFCGDYEESKQLYEEGLAMREKGGFLVPTTSIPPTPRDGDLYIEMRDFAPSRTPVSQVMTSPRRVCPKDTKVRRSRLRTLAACSSNWVAPPKLNGSPVADWNSQSNATRRQTHRPPQYWMGRCLIDLGKYDEAERHLNIPRLENRLADEKQLPWRAVVMARLGKSNRSKKLC
ncbi:MAG: tetratricopeptide repeat protein [Phycisphaerae bacterium]